MQGVALLSVALSLPMLLSACAGPTAVVDDADTLPVDASRYNETFEAAVAAVRAKGYTTAFRDPEAGVIETEPVRAGTILEPWRVDNTSFAGTLEQTAGMRRRRIRIEIFSPAEVAAAAVVEDALRAQESTGDDAGAAPDADQATEATAPARLRGPRLLADAGDVQRGPLHASGPLMMRAVVSIEQAHTPGLRRFTWSRLLTTRTIDPEEPIDPSDGVLATSRWTPIGRDHLYERQLLEDVARRLASASESASSSSATSLSATSLSAP